MIRPDEVRPVGSKPPSFEIHAKSLEQRTDVAIKNANDTGRWPAKVHQPRTPYPVDVVDAVAAKYSDAGWVVKMSNGAGLALLIDRPVTSSDPKERTVLQELELLHEDAKGWLVDDPDHADANLRAAENRIRLVLELARRTAQ